MRAEPESVQLNACPLLFDFDGTLAALQLDFAAMRRRVAELVAAHAPDFPPRHAGPQPLWTLELIDAVCHHLDGSGAASHFREQALAAIEEVEMAAAATCHWLPGAREALALLRSRGHPIAVVTRNCRRAVMAITGGTDWCDGVFTRDEVREVKPDPRHLHTALGALGVAAAGALMIGDHAQDMRVARVAGLRGVGVLTGSSTREELRAAGALAVLNSVADLPEWLPRPCPPPTNA